jgi:hypothetical protein
MKRTITIKAVIDGNTSLSEFNHAFKAEIESEVQRIIGARLCDGASVTVKAQKFWKEGQVVKATQKIEFDDFGKKNHLHASFGDEGVVEYVDDDDMPTVRFKKSGTATIVDNDEIELVPQQAFVDPDSDHLELLLENGVIQEVNRRILHPLGLAIMVTENDEGENISIKVVSSQTGWHALESGGLTEPIEFAGGPSFTKARFFEMLETRARGNMLKLFGRSTVQPVNNEESLQGYLGTTVAFASNLESILQKLSFGEALEAAKIGLRIQRDGWNGKGQYVQLQRPDANSKMGLPYLYITTVDGKRVPWLASQTDMLAEDWRALGDDDATNADIAT